TELRTQRINEVVEALRTDQDNLFDLGERIRAAEDVLVRTQIRAQLDGRVVGLKVHTPGGVVGPGEALMDIVPSDVRLIVEGKIDPGDIEIIDPVDLNIADIQSSGPVGNSNIRLARAPFEGFTEKGEFGQLPRISSSGRKPSEVYTRPYQQQDARDAPVRIAIMITGVGISSSGTREAIERLPGEVTLAFAPYGDGLQTWVNRARANGHEVMLQIPMEPFDYPDNDPGPHTLLTDSRTSENINRLNWLLSRFGGYFGITNYMGARFTADDKALTPVMAELASRGLSYVDDGGSPRSRAIPVAIAEDIDAKRADIIIDAGQSRESIEAALRRLETIAKERGSAVGVGTALPITVKTISEWAKSLRSRGIALAPVSALLNPAEG
ncbi:MAG: divergent polysaccharide deacetylase family protein, partial [Hyphomicrobiales bacterium]